MGSSICACIDAPSARAARAWPCGCSTKSPREGPLSKLSNSLSRGSLTCGNGFGFAVGGGLVDGLEYCWIAPSGVDEEILTGDAEGGRDCCDGVRDLADAGMSLCAADAE